MEEGRLTSDHVQVWTVRRRFSERAARVGVGLFVLPVVLSMLGLAIDSFLPGVARALGHGLWQVVASVWAGSWMFFTPLAFLLSLFASFRARSPHDRVSVKGGSLTLGGQQFRALDREEIEGAIVVVPDKEPAHTEIALRSGDVLHVQAGSEGDASQDHLLVEALGFGGKKRRASLPLGGTRGLFRRGLAAVGAGFAASIVGLIVALNITSSTNAALLITEAIFLLTVFLVARVAGPHRVVAGADGLVVERLFGATFLPRRHIFGVEKIAGGVSVLLRGADEKIRQIPLPADRPERVSALLRTLRDALDGDSGEGEAGPQAALLARGGEPIAKWRERLRKLVVTEGGYRARRLPVDTLVRTARDPSAPAELRIGAALAIAETDDEDAKMRLRIATEGVANEPVRTALEAAAVAEAEDEAIAEALDRAERVTRSSA